MAAVRRSAARRAGPGSKADPTQRMRARLAYDELLAGQVALA